MAEAETEAANDRVVEWALVTVPPREATISTNPVGPVMPLLLPSR